MRLRQLQKQKLHDLGWYLAGFVVVQLALAVGVDLFWPAIRDPDFEDLERIVRARQAEAPGHPLVLALGSSRTRMGLRAQQLNTRRDATAPVVVNCGVDAAGPMMFQLLLRRLLTAGIRPQQVFVEIMPMALSARRGAPNEERRLPAERISVAELACLCSYYAQPYRLFYPWVRARALPSIRNHAELRGALALDIAAGGQNRCESGRDAYGWYGCPTTFSAAEIAAQTKRNLDWYQAALTQPAVAPGALQAYRDVVHLCVDQHIAIVFVVPPEGSAFRSYAPQAEQSHMNAAHRLAQELAVPLIDARTWVDDDGFWDGHHLTQQGANQYTERFARAVAGSLQ